MGFVRALTIEDDGSSRVACRLISKDGRPAYPEPKGVYGMMILGHRIPHPSGGGSLGPEDGDEFLAELCNHYCGSRLQVTELEYD